MDTEAGNSDFFEWYKERQRVKVDIAIMEEYINNSDDFKMDCTPIPITIKKKEIKNG